VASFLEYVPLRQQTQCPDLLISNDVLLRIRRGDSLDYSNLLCSLLRGSGYNAFVVYGVAKYAVTVNDQSNDEVDPELLEATKWPGDGEKEPVDDRSGAEDDGGPAVDDRPSAAANDDDDDIPEHYQMAKGGRSAVRRYSDYVEDVERAQRRQKERELSQLNGIQKKELLDPLKQRRVHFWVLLKGGLREIDGEDLMVEPVSGRMYPVSCPEAPFLSVESVWNDSNYWVNVEQCKGGKKRAVHEMSFDLDDTKKWEFLMDPVPADGGSNIGDSGGNPQSGDGHENENGGEQQHKERVLLPASWMAPFFVAQSHIDRPFPRQSKCVEFSKCSVTKCNRFHSANGLILKLTLFADDSQLIINEIREVFSDRKDLLTLRITKLRRTHNVIYERFAIGRCSGIKELIAVGDERRTTTFYDDSRSDGMVRRTECFGSSVTERFRERSDGVVRRTLFLEATASAADREREGKDNAVRLCLAGDANLECWLQKIEQEFENSELSNPDGGGGADVDRVRLLSIDVLRSEYALDYHYGANRILSKKCTFAKETGSVVGWNPNPLSTNPDAVALKQHFEELIVTEKNLLAEVRERERAFGQMLSRMEDERSQQNKERLIDDVYAVESAQSPSARHRLDTAQPPPLRTPPGSDSVTAAARSHSAALPRHSMLHSFLPKVTESKHGDDAAPQALSREQIDQIKEDSLRELKERLVQRLNVITKRLHREIQATEKEKARFEARSRCDGDGAGGGGAVADGVGDDEERRFRAKQKESEFRIGIIKQRLAKHEQDAISKMNRLSDLLDSHPALQY